MYFHIWELDTDQPVISAANWIQRIRHYRNLAGMPERVQYFLERYPFTSIKNYLDLEDEAIIRSPPEVSDGKLIPSSAYGSKPAGIPLDIVIPCYNEEASLAYLYNTLGKFIAASAGTLVPKFIFVNDGSSDTTSEKLSTYFGDRADCALYSHHENQGIAAAIITGFKHSSADLVAVLDADCTFDPMQLIEMVPMVRDGVDIVAASPLHSRGAITNVPKWRLLLSQGAAFLYRLVLHHQLTSYTSCFRVYRRSAVTGIAVYNRGFCGVAEILARLDLSGCRIVECPALLNTRVLGQSKINLAKTTTDHLRLVGRLAAARWFKIPLPENSGK
jgi:glycosyltransferase involved in cell wall biosynthesis